MFKSILVGVVVGAVTAYWLTPDISPIEMYESGYKAVADRARDE